MLRDCRPSDAAGICRIYNHFVRETVSTFEEAPVSEAEMASRIEEVTRTLPWLVWEQAGAIRAYAYATRWKPRSAYRFTTESSVYVDPEHAGTGLGAQLYGALIEQLRARGVHCVVAGIALPNDASITLHERMGFTPVGQFSQIGWKLGRWVDIGYWQLLLDDTLD